MRKLILIFLLVAAISTIANAETKLKMELWNRWTYAMEDGDVTENEMALKRGYLRLEPVFSGNIKGRFNLDFFSDDGALDGVGMKLKYAYLDFSNFVPIKDSKLTVGLMKTYFGTIYDWSYQTIAKDPADKYKFVSSTDYGLGVSGYLPNGYGTYAVAAYNGEGYKKTGGDLNLDMNYLANLRVYVMPGVTFGGSYMKKTKNTDDLIEKEVFLDNEGTAIDTVIFNDREEYSLMSGMAKLAFGPLKITGQYLLKDISYLQENENDGNYFDEDGDSYKEEDCTQTVVSIMPQFKLNNKIDFIARYDMNDPNTDVDDDGDSTILLGMNYHILRDSKNKPKLFVQANYEMTTPEADDEDEESALMVQLRWIFSEKINAK